MLTFQTQLKAIDPLYRKMETLEQVCDHKIYQQGSQVASIKDLVDVIKGNVNLVTDELSRKQQAIDNVNNKLDKTVEYLG